MNRRRTVVDNSVTDSVTIDMTYVPDTGHALGWVDERR